MLPTRNPGQRQSIEEIRTTESNGNHQQNTMGKVRERPEERPSPRVKTRKKKIEPACVRRHASNKVTIRLTTKNLWSEFNATIAPEFFSSFDSFSAPDQWKVRSLDESVEASRRE
jgi:hypothetical protein